MKKFLILAWLTSAVFAATLTFQPLESEEDSQSYRFYSGNRPVGIVKVSSKGWISYSQGRIPDGKAVYLNENGVKVAIWPFKSGQANGVYQEFSPDGDVIKVINYQSGQRHGLFKEMWDDGTPHIVATYEKGQLNGVYKEYDEEGQLTREEKYVKGEVQRNLYFLKSIYKTNHQ